MRYRLTIELLNNPTDVPLITVIECETPYTLREDLTEWVLAEVDDDATVTQLAAEVVINERGEDVTGR